MSNDLRLLELNEKHISKLKETIAHNFDQIRGKENNVVSWISFSILFGVFQSVLTFESDLTKPYLIMVFPTMALGLLFAAKTLSKTPSFILRDFFTVEDHDIEQRLNESKASIEALSVIHLKLVDSYDYKTRWSKLVGPAIKVNIAMNVLFILFFLVFPNCINVESSTALGLLSIIYIGYGNYKSISETLKFAFATGENRKIIENEQK